MSQTELNQRIQHFLQEALTRLNQRDYDRAVENLKAAEVLDKDNPEILYNLGIAYCRMGLYHTALKYFQKVKALPFTFVEVITVNKPLSYCYMMRDNSKRPLQVIDDSLRLAPSDTTLMNLKGYCYEKDDRKNEALTLYRQILEIDHNNINAMNSLAYLLALTGADLNEAIMYAQRICDSNPDNPAYLDTLGFIHYKKGNTESARKFLKKALSLAPDSPEIREHINHLLKIP